MSCLLMSTVVILHISFAQTKASGLQLSHKVFNSLEGLTYSQFIHKAFMEQ